MQRLIKEMIPKATEDLSEVGQGKHRDGGKQWCTLLWITGAYVACTTVTATAAQLGWFSAILSDYISGDTKTWIAHWKSYSSFLELNTTFYNLNYRYYQILDAISPLMIPLTNMVATILAILLMGACGMKLSRKTGLTAASLIAFNPFFWLVALGPAKEPVMVGLTASALVLIMRVRIPAILWVGAGLLFVAGLFLRLEFTVALTLGTGCVLLMRKQGLERFVSLEWSSLTILMAIVSATVLGISLSCVQLAEDDISHVITIGLRWMAINGLLVALWISLKRRDIFRGRVTPWTPSSTGMQLSVKILLLLAVVGGIFLPMVLSNPGVPLPNGRRGLNTEIYYEYFDSRNPPKAGAVSLQITRTLAGSQWTAPLNVGYRLMASTVHGPLRPIFLTKDGRIPLYMIFQWLNEFMVTLGIPAAALVLLTRKPAGKEYGRTIAALACGLSVLLACFPTIHVRYFVPLMPFFILLVALISRKERKVLVIITVVASITGPIGLYMLGAPPVEVTAQELAPGDNPFLPSWVEHQRPAD